jgi:hypothetical protein
MQASCNEAENKALVVKVRSNVHSLTILEAQRKSIQNITPLKILHYTPPENHPDDNKCNTSQNIRTASTTCCFNAACSKNPLQILTFHNNIMLYYK